jgi:hypothetical protein
MLTPWTELTQRRRVRMSLEGSTRAMRRVDRLVASEQFVDWVSGRVHASSSRGRGGRRILRRTLLHVRGDVDLCAAIRSRGGTVLFTPACEVTHLRGRSVAKAGNACRTDALRPEPCGVLRKARSGMGTVAPALAASTRQDNPLESPRSRAHLRIAIDARKLHDYGIGTVCPESASRARASGR